MHAVLHNAQRAVRKLARSQGEPEWDLNGRMSRSRSPPRGLRGSGGRGGLSSSGGPPIGRRRGEVEQSPYLEASRAIMSGDLGNLKPLSHYLNRAAGPQAY